jgi:RNA 2',3'-cyclic 3'-phosphodiesterase
MANALFYLSREPMRLFVALDLEDEIRRRIENFINEVRELAPGARWVNPESLHVTLKFIGEKPDSMMKQIEETLASIKGQALSIRYSETGFFPTPRSARVFWIGIQAGAGLAGLARKVEDGLAGIGIPREKRAFSPHLTLARASGGSGAPGWRKSDKTNRVFATLQERLAQRSPTDFGSMSARDFFLYRSQLSPKGSKYTKMARFELGSPGE